MQDKKIICKDCGKEFVFTVGEQEFYQSRGFENEPVRCPDCRKAKKSRNADFSRKSQRGTVMTVPFLNCFIAFAKSYVRS